MPVFPVLALFLAYPPPFVPPHLAQQEQFLSRADKVRAGQTLALLRVAEAGVRQPLDTPAIARTRGVILLMGRLRLEPAVPFLVEHLTFPGSRDGLVRLSPYGPDQLYPCAAALGQIGGSSVNSVLGAAEESDDPLRHSLTALALVRALGPELAADFLTRRRDTLPVGERCTRVDAVLKEVPTATVLGMARGRNTGQFMDRPLFDPPDPARVAKP